MKSWKHKKRKDAVGNPVSCSVNKIFKPRSIKKLKAQNPISCPPTKTFRPENHSKKCNVPTKTSQLKNDGEDGINPFITAQDIPPFPAIPTNTSQLVNDGADGVNPFITAQDLPPAINQDNIIPMLYLGIYDGDEGLSFDDLFQRELEIDQTEIYLLYAIKKIDGAVPDLESPLNQVLDPTKFILQKYLFKGGKGTYNPIPNQLNVNIYLIEESSPTLEEMQIILQGANTQTFDLGDITNEIETWGSFWEYINNSGPYDITDPDKEYYFLFQQGDITYLYFFIGANNNYGIGEAQSVFNDYLLVTTSDTVTVVTPSWQQTIDVNRNADRATLYHVTYNGGLFGGYTAFPSSPTVIIQDPVSGRIYYYGYFLTYQNVVRNHVVAALPDGTIDDSFNVGTGFNNFPFNSTRIAIQPDGKVVFTGSFTNYNGTPANRIIRLNTDGSVDTSFVYGTGFNNFTLGAVLDNNNKIYVTGIFTTYNGNTGRNRIIRLNSDGSIDSGFNQGTGFNNTVTGLVVDSNNDIYVVGYFASWKGATGNNRIIKILENGDKDTSFNTGTGFNSGNNQPLQVYLTSDNKVFVIGYFTLYNGTTINKMVKLNLDGTIDTSFQSQGTGFNGTHVAEFFEYQGNYVLSGDFTSYNGVPSQGTIILDTSGNIVRTFPEFTQVKNILNDGRLIGINWTGSAYNVGVLEDNYIVNLKRFNYDETNGKATYEIGGLLSTTEEEILPKRLIRELIQLEAPSTPIPTNTSSFINDGEDGINPYITANDVSSLSRQEFTYTTGLQEFTLLQEPSAIYNVFVNGQELLSTQYSVSTDVLTILDPLVNGDTISVIYSAVPINVPPSYTKVETDNLLLGKEDLTNKATDLSDPNNDEYPTTQAVVNGIENINFYDTFSKVLIWKYYFGTAAALFSTVYSITESGGINRTFSDGSYSRLPRRGFRCSATAGSTAGARVTTSFMSMNSIEYIEMTFGNGTGAATSGMRFFVGIQDSNADIASNIDYDTLTGIIGVGRIVGSNNLHIIHNDASGTATKIDLGANFPVNVVQSETDSIYKMVITKSGADVIVTVFRLNTSFVESRTLTSDLPVFSDAIFWKCGWNNNTNAVTFDGDLFGVTIKLE